ncbi:uncharacterized protein ASCRUDRAFT_112587 [Ascoidea rubescens DSM 1968]|uniref:Uncharacterized protein n=1 Tax=Ascoidea rubescens DSM 1968 TaxID=1344418 RepID=A0A1D2VCS8_9ASCO|nr:hypothetical protein ASCRUDRAFT_112587 [Ascoidea rubescens DSM 1968]ODV59435.1 hypothetical protein ASCRUDRAFT_112587 [Ascoidea rubescens DSM 1968]
MAPWGTIGTSQPISNHPLQQRLRSTNSTDDNRRSIGQNVNTLTRTTARILTRTLTRTFTRTSAFHKLQRDELGRSQLVPRPCRCCLCCFCLELRSRQSLQNCSHQNVL